MDAATVALIQAHWRRAQEALESARVLLPRNLLADCLSSAYYAVFHAAEALLETEGQIAKTHEGVRTLFGLHFVKTGKVSIDLGKILNFLRHKRIAINR